MNESNITIEGIKFDKNVCKVHYKVDNISYLGTIQMLDDDMKISFEETGERNNLSPTEKILHSAVLNEFGYIVIKDVLRMAVKFNPYFSVYKDDIENILVMLDQP